MRHDLPLTRGPFALFDLLQRFSGVCLEHRAARLKLRENVLGRVPIKIPYDGTR